MKMAGAEEIESFFAAVARSDHIAVQNMVEQLPEIVNARLETPLEDKTPLIQAVKVCHSGKLEVIQALLKNGADISGTGRMPSYYMEGPLGQNAVKPYKSKDGGYGANDGIFPLFVASTFTLNVEAVLELIKQGADVNQTTAIGQSALHAASKNKDGSQLARFTGYKPKQNEKAQNVMRALIDAGANVNLKDNWGRTPLHYACINANVYLIRILVEKGADLNIRDNQGLSILEAAALSSTATLEEISPLISSRKEVCEAYEICCLSEDHISCQNLLKGMKKVAQIKEENKESNTTTVNPDENFGTIDVAGIKDDDLQGLLNQCVLARENIFRGRYMPFDGGEITSVIRSTEEKQQNEMLLRFLDVFRQNEDYLYFGEKLLAQGCPLKIYAINNHSEILNIATIVTIIDLAFESAKVIESTLEKETRRGATKELICELEEVIVAIGVFVTWLFKKGQSQSGSPQGADDSGIQSEDQLQLGSRSTSSSQPAKVSQSTSGSPIDIARSTLDKLICSFPSVSHPAVDYHNPLVNILLCKNHNLFIIDAGVPILPNYDLITLLMEIMDDRGIFNVNEKDSYGNTPLLVACSPFVVNPRQSQNLPDPYGTTDMLVQLFLEKGAYVHARNNSKQSVFDFIEDEKYAYFYERVNLLKIVGEYSTADLPSLKQRAALCLKESNVDIANRLPDALEEFVNLH